MRAAEDLSRGDRVGKSSSIASKDRSLPIARRAQSQSQGGIVRGVELEDAMKRALFVGLIWLLRVRLTPSRASLPRRRRSSRSIRSGLSRCRITGSPARRSACRSTPRTACGRSIARVPSRRTSRLRISRLPKPLTTRCSPARKERKCTGHGSNRCVLQGRTAGARV